MRDACIIITDGVGLLTMPGSFRLLSRNLRNRVRLFEHMNAVLDERDRTFAIDPHTFIWSYFVATGLEFKNTLPL